MKKILYVLGALALVFAIGVVILMFSLGSIVKAGVNNVGPRITQSKVELKDAKISPFSGQGTLKELTIGNPAGWTTPHAFFLKEISISMDPKSLKGDHVVINSILIDRPEITYETTTLTTSNLQDLLNNIQKSAGGTTEPGQPQPPAEPQPQGEPAEQIKIEIKSFRLQNATINVSAGGKSYTVTMPEFLMENIGSREGGLTPEQVAVVVMKEITARVVKLGVNEAAKKGLFDKAGEGLRDLLGGKK